MCLTFTYMYMFNYFSSHRICQYVTCFLLLLNLEKVLTVNAPTENECPVSSNHYGIQNFTFDEIKSINNWHSFAIIYELSIIAINKANQ